MKRTNRRGRRTEAEIRKLVASYENGTQSRAAFCAEHGVPLTTLDYYRRRFRPVEPSLVEIDIHGSTSAGAHGGLRVVLRNQRRLELEWSELARVNEHSQPLRAFVRWLEEA